MRPVRLEMQGFATFREHTEVDFSDVELVALVGPTGAGKSSIIDAMTFALYGSAARYDEKAVAPVINQLSAEARVRFDFEVGEVNFSATRIVRRTKTGGGTTKEARLERDGVLIAGDAKEVTGRVTTLLGLDFERFNKTVVLPQGKFADFLHDKPASRQELLRELLGLGVYQRLAMRARELASQHENRAAVLENSLEASGDLSDDRLTELEASAKAIAKVRVDFSKRATTLEETDQSLEQLERETDELEANLELLASVDEPDGIQELVENMADVTAAERAALTRRDASRAALKASGAAVKAGPSMSGCRQILDSYRRKHEVTERLAEITKRLKSAKTTATATEQRLKAVEASIRSARVLFDETRGKRAELETAVKKAGNPAELRLLLSKLDELEDLKSGLGGLKTAVRTAAETSAATSQASATATDALRALERSAPAATLAAQLHVGETCPVCNQVVHSLPKVHAASESKLAAARKSENTAQKAATAADRAHTQAVARLEAALEYERQLTAELKKRPDRAAAETLLERAIDLEQQAEQAREAAEAAEHALARLEMAPATVAARDEERAAAVELSSAVQVEASLKIDLSRIIAELNGKPTEKETKANLATADELAEAHRVATEEEQLADEEYSACKARLDEVVAHEREARDEFMAIREELLTLKPPKATKSLGEDWIQLVKWANSVEATLAKKHSDSNATRLRLTTKREQLAQSIEDLVSEFVDDSGATLAELRDRLAQVDADAKMAIEWVHKERKRLARARAEIETLKADGQVASLLGTLLKNDRFQRWLLEEAMIDLVEKATVRLRELTMGQYSLVAEVDSFKVIDHANADEIRDARSLSGGETFLTSLALALALAESSMDLATEGTAQLEAIFLDEGFGSLDPESLEVVAGAIEELATAGRMVGIVTHIRDLAERMPTRLEVSKVNGNSSVLRVDA